MNLSSIRERAVASGKYLAVTVFVVAVALAVTQKSTCDCHAAPPSDGNAAVIPEKTVTAALPKLVDFGAKACDACKKIAPILDELTQEYAGVFDVVFIDVWQKENAEKAKTHNIETIPTQIFFAPDGKELFRHVGFISKEDILKKWQELGYDMKPKAKSKEKADEKTEAPAEKKGE
jgi:thioredoxin 1